MTSTARIEANRANARKSTGPKTAEGKARSRWNALTHGLRAEQVVLPGEDAGAFEAERAAFFDEWNPPTATRAVLVERMVADAWRLRRCVRVEGARLRRIADEASRRYDAALNAEMEETTAQMATDPGRAVDRLGRSRPGAERLRLGWERLAEALRHEGDWRHPGRHHEPLCRLLGLDPTPPPAELGDVAVASWTLMVTHDPDLARDLPWDDSDGELSRPLPPARAEKVRGLLLDLAEREAGRLAEMAGRLPDPDEARDRYLDEHCFDASKDAASVHRYEAAHDRSFRANLRSLIELTRTGADFVAGEDLPDLIEVTGSDGATLAAEPGPSAEAPIEAKGPTSEPPRGPDAPIEANDPARATAEVAEAPIEPMPVVTVAQAERDRGGRVWPTQLVDGGDDGPRSLPIYR